MCRTDPSRAADRTRSALPGPRQSVAPSADRPWLQAAFRFDWSASSRPSRAKCSNSVVRYSSRSVPASSMPRRSSFSACAVTATLTRYTATPIATTVSSALAKKIRLVREEKIVIAGRARNSLRLRPLHPAPRRAAIRAARIHSRQPPCTFPGGTFSSRYAPSISARAKYL